MAEKVRKEVKRKKTRRRKNRRDVEISSSSSSSESEESEKEAELGNGVDVEMDDGHQSNKESEMTDEQESFNQPKKFSEADFNTWYLQQVTKELDEDLDKIRSASDFKDSSLAVLITALQQGTSLFSAEEKQRLLGGAS